MEVSFYKYTGQRNVIDKSLPEPVKRDGRLTGLNVRTPVVVTRGDVTGFTMCHIGGSVNRYYFVEAVEYDGDKAHVSLSCDVLTTFAEQIKNATGTLFSTDTPHRYDDNFKPTCDVRTEKKKFAFPIDGLTETGSIVMITIKGNK